PHDKSVPHYANCTVAMLPGHAQQADVIVSWQPLKSDANRRAPMILSRRQILHCAAGALAVPALGRGAAAQTYPNRPVRLIVPFGPGGGTDVAGRLIGQWLSERLGQQFVIDNRPGAGSNIGTEAVVRANPDGYTLALIGAPAAINATLYRNL